MAIWEGRGGEDAGTGFGYERGAFTRTSFTQSRGETVSVRIAPVRGKFRGALRKRTWELHVLGVPRPEVVAVDGRRVRRWTYDATTRSVTVVLKRVPSRRGAVVELR